MSRVESDRVHIQAAVMLPEAQCGHGTWAADTACGSMVPQLSTLDRRRPSPCFENGCPDLESTCTAISRIQENNLNGRGPEGWFSVPVAVR